MICSRCVMDISDPEIKFDQNNFCNLCTDFLENRIQILKKDFNKFEELIDKIKFKNKKKDFDILIGVSGGADSSYLLHLANQYQLRVLALHVDNGFNSIISVKNIKKIIDKTKSTYKCFVLPWTSFKKVQNAFILAQVPEIDTPYDIAILKWQYHFSSDYKISDIFSGGNYQSEGILPKSWHYNARDMIYAKGILKKQNIKLKNFKSMQFDLFEEIYFRAIKRIKIHNPLNYLGYDKEKSKELLKLEYSWEDPPIKHGESLFTRFLHSYYLYEKFGIDYRRTELSCKILTRKISRKQALKILEKKPYDQEMIQKVNFIENKLSLPKNYFINSIKSNEKYYYSDNRNNENFLGNLYSLYRRLNGIKKSTNF